LAGWRTARGRAPLQRPPEAALERRIGFRESLRMRRGVYLARGRVGAA